MNRVLPTDAAPTNLVEARGLIARLQAALQARQGVLRAPPPEPTACCGRGCNGCVWEGYYAALAGWREDALALLASLQPKAQAQVQPQVQDKAQADAAAP